MDADEKADFWERHRLESPIRGIETVRDGARQLITVTALLQGVYFAVISVSDCKSQATVWQLALLLAPAVLWLLSLFYALGVVVPADFTISCKSPGRDLEAICEKKYRRMRVSYAVLLGSLVVLLADLCIYLFLIPVPPP